MLYGYGYLYMITAQVLFFAITLGLIIWFVKSTKKINDEKYTQDPKEILKTKLVLGEITIREFDILMKKISENNNFKIEKK